jgi:type VI secretion system protein ImpH
MAAALRRHGIGMNARQVASPEPAIAEQLAAHPYRFSFFQAVRLLKRIETERGNDTISLLGSDATIRFKTAASLDFPASELGAYRTLEPSVLHELTVLFMGLTGPSSTLPRHYTELLIARRYHHRDDTLHAFLDLFSHRLIALFYEAWEKHRFYLPHERGAQAPFTQMVLDLIGLGPASLQRRMMDGGTGVQDHTLVYYGGLAAQRPRSAANLEAMVRDQFATPTRVKQMQGRWIRVPEAARSALGTANNKLGQTMMLGERAWECGSKIELELGPLKRAEFEALLPGGTDHVPLARLVRWFVGASTDCTIRLRLRKEDLTPARIGAATRLGHTAWIASRPATRDFDQVTFECPA